ncbi:hypothetical protein CRM22_008932 [Opisthorchis felineus]|uniref:Large ribosomal subunit protein uL10m n=1 Tax=Opisthorchis felineus TaxID=147828 RepID=A0A4V3SD80_OPIFE|nr:hypothetical protein CRM22_008932 [Opisthorchis felineus]
MSIWCPLGRKPYAVLCQPIRTRYVADPGTLEQRLFRAVTQPVIPPLGITATDRRIRKQEQQRIREENNPYRKFLLERARSDFFGEADDRMVLVIQPLHHKWREFVPIRNQLFLKNLVFHGFPVPILREAAIGTRWENFTECFLRTNSHNFYLFGDADPLVCRNALSVLKTARFLLLLGGVVQHRIMTVNQLQEYASLASSGGLDGARGRLLGLLGCKSQELLSTMTKHQTDIVFGLHHLGCSATKEN